MTKILLVDDERMSNRLIQMSLQMDGFAVVTAQNLGQAREKLTADVQGVLVDFHLPQNTTGITLLQEIRAGETVADPQIVVIMASGDDRKQIDAEQNGANLFLLKPFSPADLADHFKELIGE